MSYFNLKVGTTANNLVPIRTPSKWQWGLQRVSAAESGRTDDGEMHVNEITQKRKIECAWNGVSTAEASAILKAFNPEYIYVHYHDTLDNAWQTRRFYTGDQTASYATFYAGGETLESVSFNIIEA